MMSCSLTLQVALLSWKLLRKVADDTPLGLVTCDVVGMSWSLLVTNAIKKEPLKARNPHANKTLNPKPRLVPDNFLRVRDGLGE